MSLSRMQSRTPQSLSDVRIEDDGLFLQIRCQIRADGSEGSAEMGDVLVETERSHRSGMATDSSCQEILQGRQLSKEALGQSPGQSREILWSGALERDSDVKMVEIRKGSGERHIDKQSIGLENEVQPGPITARMVVRRWS